MAAAKEKDLIPLVVDAPLATIERDGVHTAPLAAVLEGKHVVVMLKATLPPRGKKKAEPKTRTLRLTDPGECTGFVREILPQAKERGIQKLTARLEAGVDTVTLALLESKKRPAPSTEEEQYKIEGNRLWYRALGGWQPLCNFVAAITEEVIRDDGAEEKGELRITGTHVSGQDLGMACVPLDRFSAMNWPVGTWGTRAVVGAGMGTKDRLREAIQLLSPDVVRRRVYAHTGWREIDGTTYFLHAGGAIGPDGPAPGIDVALEGKLGRAALPDPPTGQELAQAVRASLRLLALAPATVTSPVLGAVYRAPLSHAVPMDASIFLLGPSGSFKSELTALAQAHYGTFDRLTLPGAWLWTGNSLERQSFVAKDILFVVDDFIPTGTTQEMARCHATADRFLRAVGNHAGRGRLTADGRLRPEYVPRSVVLSSGEELPKGHSLGARILVVDVASGDIKVGLLSKGQALGAQGTFRLAMAGYIRWLAERFGCVCTEVPERFATLRDGGQADGLHARMPSTQAHLLLGWDMWLRFAEECGAVEREKAAEVLAVVRTALAELVERTQGQVAAQEPAARFVKLLASVLSTGKAHLLTMDATRPDNPERWGWHLHPVSTLDTEMIWQPSHQHIGWLDGADVYLQPGAAYAAGRTLAQAEGADIGLQPMALWKRLHQKGLLASREGDRNVVHRWIGGRQYGVLHLHASTLEDSSTPKSEKSEKSEGQGASVGGQASQGAPAVPTLDPVAAQVGMKGGKSDAANGAHPPGSATLAAARPERSAPGHHAGFSDFSDFSDIGGHSAESACDVGYPLRPAGPAPLGPVQNDSHDPHAPPPEAPCAKGHRDWVLVGSALEQGAPRCYAHVCRTCLPEDEYGVWLPQQCTQCGIYLKVRDRGGPCPGCGSGGARDGTGEPPGNDEMEELRV